MKPAWHPGARAISPPRSRRSNRLEIRNDDAASSVMIERCRQQLENPSGEDWDGTTVARTK
jgi:hypothetical protein